MHWWAAIFGIALISIILMDAFETVVLPRRIKRTFFRISSRFYRKSWRLWIRVGQHIKSANRREGFLAYFGPLAIFPLLGFWALGLIFGFACVQYGLAEYLSRLGCCPEQMVLDEIFRDWERWCADLLSSHISYPVLVFFRSQHGNQSWLSALTAMLDVSSLIMIGVDGIHADQAKLTFAMARHAVVDLAQVVNAEYSPHDVGRLAPEELKRLRSAR